jgi:hypothetical protein
MRILGFACEVSIDPTEFASAFIRLIRVVIPRAIRHGSQ